MAAKDGKKIKTFDMDLLFLEFVFFSLLFGHHNWWRKKAKTHRLPFVWYLIFSEDWHLCISCSKIIASYFFIMAHKQAVLTFKNSLDLGIGLDDFI
jgi:hypothetical protein